MNNCCDCIHEEVCSYKTAYLTTVEDINKVFKELENSGRPISIINQPIILTCSKRIPVSKPNFRSKGE